MELAVHSGRARTWRFLTPQREPISVVVRITPHSRCGHSLSSGSLPSVPARVGHTGFAPQKSGQSLKNLNVLDYLRRMIYSSIYIQNICVRLQAHPYERVSFRSIDGFIFSCRSLPFDFGRGVFVLQSLRFDFDNFHFHLGQASLHIFRGCSPASTTICYPCHERAYMRAGG